MQLDNLLQQSWKNHPSACEPALAVMRRVWLCEMRGVSTGWRNAGEYLGRLRLRFSRLAFLLAGIHLAALTLKTSPQTDNLRASQFAAYSVHSDLLNSLSPIATCDRFSLPCVQIQLSFTRWLKPRQLQAPHPDFQTRESSHLRKALWSILHELYEGECAEGSQDDDTERT